MEGGSLRKITETTLFPLSLVILIAGGVFWLSSVYSTASTTKDEVTLLRQKQDEYYDAIQKVDERLSRIEGKLGINLNESEK